MSDREIISRAEAKSLGLTRYYTGVECKNGHVAERMERTRSCLECHAHSQRARREANAEKVREQELRYRESSREKRSAGQRQYYHANKEKVRQYRANNAERLKEYDRQYQVANAERKREYRQAHHEKISERNRQWREANPHKCRAVVRSRQARKLQATPGWFDKAAVEAIYHEAAFLSVITGIEHQVDHIIPLKGKNVCGLHVQNNLMAIPREWNASKSAKLIDDHDEWLLSQMLRAA